MSKTIALTGGASGMGAATVKRLQRLGHEIYVLDVAEPTAEKTAANIHYLPCNLAREQDIETALAELPTALDGVVNVAGVATTPNPVDTVAINFLGMRTLTEALLPRIHRGGSVVIVASTAGWKWRDFETDLRGLLNTISFSAGQEWLASNTNLWHSSPYHFSKRCAAAYTYAATQLALPLGVRVNCVNPGVTETQLSPAFRELVGDNLYDWGVEQIGRAGTPDDIAEVIEFLAVGECRWLNGQEIVVDGGYIAGLTGGWIDPSLAPA